MTVETDNICQDKKHLNGNALRAYTSQVNSSRSELEDDLITSCLPMVNSIVRQVVTYLKPPLTFEDMVSAGTLGLVKAARDYDPSQQAEFKTYAYIRIKGAILDELRGWTFIPANLNKKIRDAQSVSQKITEKTGIAPTDEELARKLGITVDELLEMFESARTGQFVSLEANSEDSLPLGSFLAADYMQRPDRQIEQKELIGKLAEAIQQLSLKHRQIIILYYERHLTMKQIADVLEITESRVSQLHASAMFNLSVKLRKLDDGGL